MRFIVPAIVMCGALFCFWAAVMGKKLYRRELLGPGESMPRWQARFVWTFCGLALLLAVWSMLDYSAKALK